MTNFFTTRDHSLAPGPAEDWREMYQLEADQDGYALAYEIVVDLVGFVGLVWVALKFLD